MILYGWTAYKLLRGGDRRVIDVQQRVLGMRQNPVQLR
jgi:hypothetical protein